MIGPNKRLRYQSIGFLVALMSTSFGSVVRGQHGAILVPPSAAERARSRAESEAEQTKMRQQWQEEDDLAAKAGFTTFSIGGDIPREVRLKKYRDAIAKNEQRDARLDAWFSEQSRRRSLPSDGRKWLDRYQREYQHYKANRMRKFTNEARDTSDGGLRSKIQEANRKLHELRKNNHYPTIATRDGYSGSAGSDFSAVGPVKSAELSGFNPHYSRACLHGRMR